MNEHKLSALMRYQAGFRKHTGITGALSLAARFFKYDKPRSEKLSGAAKKRFDMYGRKRYPYKFKNNPVVMMLVNIRLPQNGRVKRGNPARNPTALV